MYGYATALVLNERQPTVSRESLRTTDSPGADIAGTRLDQAYAFSFQVLRPMGLTSMEHTLSPESNLQTLEKRTSVRGMVRAPSQAAAQAYLDAFMGGLNLGKLLVSTVEAENRRGPTET